MCHRPRTQTAQMPRTACARTTCSWRFVFGGASFRIRFSTPSRLWAQRRLGTGCQLCPCVFAWPVSASFRLCNEHHTKE